ncbi:hypothetical protein [Holophaga foetida]|uniref:hypothetical protein n=1 Tax=Holophaga foetida TaxID=35839 RepID=UPI0002472EC7|nr:hypothetical protein [Holophaga foetida]
MAANIKSKEIQVQKPAQSLQAFQRNLASGHEVQEGLLKPVLIGVGAVLVVVVAFFGIRAWRAGAVERHEAAVGEVVMAAQGNGLTPVPTQDLEKRMRENLPRLEALAKAAPSSQRAGTEALVAAWKLSLDGKGAVPLRGSEPWDRLRAAQKALAMGQDKEAAQVLASLRKDAGPDTPWASLFWDTQLELDSLQGNREQAWKDLAEFKTRFKDKGDTRKAERIIQGI